MTSIFLAPNHLRLHPELSRDGEKWPSTGPPHPTTSAKKQPIKTRNEWMVYFWTPYRNPSSYSQMMTRVSFISSETHRAFRFYETILRRWARISRNFWMDNCHPRIQRLQLRMCFLKLILDKKTQSFSCFFLPLFQLEEPQLMSFANQVYHGCVNVLLKMHDVGIESLATL